MDYSVEVEHLSKSYGEVKAVNDISFRVRQGSLFAFLGVNGAGKSTTINIICSILKKDAGRVTVCGHDLDREGDRIKEEIGIVFQTSVLDKQLTVAENLDLRASFYGLSRAARKKNVERIVELLSLQPILKRPVGNLSGGQQRRVDIARAMVHDPRLLMLDEPSTGLDPKARLAVWSLIDGIRAETGMTVFLTTHYLEEAEKAGYVVIMDRGQIIAEGTPNELKNRYSYDSLLSYRKRDEAFEKGLLAEGYRFSYDGEKRAYRIVIENSEAAKRLMQRFDGYTTDIEIIKGTMDDVFLNVTGRDIVTGEEHGENKA
ncbi:MAG TPA: ABC transporter ATP-binding protein [Candidatus Gallimonas gallistercoris]|uniref:ABC transporter ATP-binding protein n=1 Tax=Candidatus Gallimonas gallistercoris TaxID=2838602 RepID=A0A9D2H120_9FIRM|nr:ABC transporter ATP-binding protein [Candidatus Gallimonas gallistercoris]